MPTTHSTTTTPAETRSVRNTIDVTVDGDSVIDADLAADIERFADIMARWRAGEIGDDEFRVFRLSNGVYGQRQGGENQMIRIKAPYGALSSAQLRCLADISERYSRGWGHLTTRQNIQFHFVALDDVEALMWDLARVGLTTREACSDTVRNVTGCHLAGACPHEVLDIQPWAEATFRHFLRNPISARLPRKFKINFSGCVTDCGQAMFNDIGVIAVNHTHDDGTREAGFRVYVAGGLGANPHPAVAIEEFTPRHELLATLEACVRVFEQCGRRDNKLRARMKWLVDTLGFDELRDRVLTSRRWLIGSATWPDGVPAIVEERGDTPAGAGGTVTEIGWGTPVTLTLRNTGVADRTGFDHWKASSVIQGRENGTVSAIAYCELGDITANQFRQMADLVDELGVSLRITNRQNFAVRDIEPNDLETVWRRLDAANMAAPSAELARDVVACPGADTCNLALTQSRGLASAISEALETNGLGELDGVRINISGCTNSCGQHHVADIGFHGIERRANKRSVPGYQLLIGGHLGDEHVEFGTRAGRFPAKAAPDVVVQILAVYEHERNVGEAFRGWVSRTGGVERVAELVAELTAVPEHDTHPEFYVDYDETGPYEAVVGDSECAV